MSLESQRCMWSSVPLVVQAEPTLGNKTKTPGPGAQSALSGLARSGMKIGRIGKKKNFFISNVFAYCILECEQISNIVFVSELKRMWLQFLVSYRQYSPKGWKKGKEALFWSWPQLEDLFYGVISTFYFLIDWKEIWITKSFVVVSTPKDFIAMLYD